MPEVTNIAESCASLQLLTVCIDSDNYVFCPRHFDKPIEYFCKQCSITVCVKCMFDEHNGHDLI